jgi:hypothetical protein
MPLCKKDMDPNCSKLSKESPQKAKESGKIIEMKSGVN